MGAIKGSSARARLSQLTSDGMTEPKCRAAKTLISASQQHLDLVLWLPFERKPFQKLACISAKLSPLEVMQRAAIWADLSCGWGLLHPPTAFAGLFYISMEKWAHRTAMRDLG